MEFGVLFTSHPNPKEEPYPHRDVHARTTDEVIEAERLGYDTAWIAEHHFATSYGIMPDCFAYMAYLAAKTSRIKIGAAVITLPLYDPIRVVENTSFVDILSNGRVRLGVGSGYRPYEFEGLGRDFDGRRDIVEEAIGLMFDAWHRHRWDHKGKYFSGTVRAPYEMLPHPIQMPHPPLYMAGGTDRSIGYCGPQRLRPDAVDLAQHRDAGGADRALQARARHRHARSGAGIRRPARSTSPAGSTSPTPTSRRAPTPRRRSSATSRISAARAPAAISARCRRRAARSSTTTFCHARCCTARPRR